MAAYRRCIEERATEEGELGSEYKCFQNVGSAADSTVDLHSHLAADRLGNPWPDAQGRYRSIQLTADAAGLELRNRRAMARCEGVGTYLSSLSGSAFSSLVSSSLGRYATHQLSRHR